MYDRLEAADLGGMFCSHGECSNSSYAANQDMLKVISTLASMQEIQKEVAGKNLKNPAIFKGKQRECRRAILGFKNCCKVGRGSGWGVALHLAHCDEDERTLAEQRKQKLCHEVGHHTKTNALGIKTRLTRFCCFGSKLARIIHEQGRGQLGMKWGTGEHPQCREEEGLTIEDLSKLDFSRINFSEIFSEMMANYAATNPAAKAEEVQQRMKNKFGPPESETPFVNPKTQRHEAHAQPDSQGGANGL
jgi:hypothetical protein